MERKRRIRGKVLTLLATVFLSAGCSDNYSGMKTEVRINFSCHQIQTRADMPDENLISDISLMIFDEEGFAEENIRIADGSMEHTSRLTVGREYTICACANLGHQVSAGKIDELDGIRYHLAYPDDYRHGIPMYARKEFTIADGQEELTVEFERLMAKISIRMDRRKLSEDVEMYVRSVQIGNCPRTASVFKTNRIEDRDDFFPAGFFLNGTESDYLNEVSASGLSKSVSLYMPENMQGIRQNEFCSYIELTLDYTSETHYSGADGLIYRFYLGEGRNDMNIERNSHYHIVVTPEDDGLSDDGWRVDKSDLHYSGPIYIKGYPSDYIIGDIGDRVHIWCDLLPEDAPFDVGESYMKDDKANGIYDYEIDKDGHGATLTLTGPGTGLIYMEAGDPINDAALFIIEVNMP